MALLTPTRGHQDVLVAEFLFNYNDTMVNTVGNTVDFGLLNAGAGAGIFDIINLPVNSIVVGGSISTMVAFDTAGYDVIVGDSVDDDRYHATADIKGVATVALLTTGYLNTGGLPLRLKFSSDDVCSTGQMLVRVEYIIRGRVCEIVPN